MNPKRIIILMAIAAFIASYFIFDLGQYLNLAYLKQQQQSLADYQQLHPIQLAVLFFFAYILVTALSLPGATIMTLAGGAIFGLLQGFILVSFASTIGATLAFLVSRFILRDWVETKFADSLSPLNEGIKKDGAFYLFGLRLVPLFPFFVINLLMGLTKIKTWTFYWVSQIGMLAGTLVYVNAGTQLSQITTVKDILSLKLILSFALLGLFPIIAKLALNYLKAKKS
jgi:uncharacterized membrane protein YdjX (TVP38/TMEM64 family)